MISHIEWINWLRCHFNKIVSSLKCLKTDKEKNNEGPRERKINKILHKLAMQLWKKADCIATDIEVHFVEWSPNIIWLLSSNSSCMASVYNCYCVLMVLGSSTVSNTGSSCAFTIVKSPCHCLFVIRHIMHKIEYTTAIVYIWHRACIRHQSLT